MRTLNVSAVVIALLVLGSSVGAFAETQEIHGGGATFPAKLYAKWIQDYNAAQQAAKLDYQAQGSGFGITGITGRTIHFAGSDAPMTEKQEAAAPGKLLHLPTVAGPVVMAYNLTGVTELVLNGEIIAEMYENKITKWNDPKIVALNPSAKLPASDITVVHRSDGSGTTWIFTNYLNKISADWKSKVGNQTTVNWPTGLAGKGNDGVAGQIKNTEGGIGYLEIAYAESIKMPYAALVNKAGKTVKASIDGVNEAAKNSAAEIPDDFKISITNAPGDASYPIAGFTYIIVYQDLSYLKNKDLATEIVKFIQYGETKGQESAAPNYAKLPDDLVKKVEEKIKTIVFDGQPIVK